MMTDQSRRGFLRSVSALLAGSLAGTGRAAPATTTMTLGFSTYGMKTLKTERALQVIDECGYDAVEVTVWPDWDAAPARMSKERRRKIRKSLGDKGLKLTSLMEHLYPPTDPKQHAQSLERLKGVFQLARDLSPDDPPVVQTVLGGGTWEAKRDFFVDRVGDWSEIGRSFGVVTCIKPHRGGALSKPSEAVWIIRKLDDTKWVRMVYDYSHYIFRDIDLVKSVRTAMPYIGHVAVKDTVKVGNRTAFKLPGEAGTIDFVTLLKELKSGGYTGDISCEVSGMVSGKPAYDPVKAAKICYANISRAFESAGVDRG